MNRHERGLIVITDAALASPSAVKALVKTAHARAVSLTRQMASVVVTTTTYLARPNLACVALKQANAGTKHNFAWRAARADLAWELPQLRVSHPPLHRQASLLEV